MPAFADMTIDLYSRRIVGWSMHDSMILQLVADALMMAVWRRGKPVVPLRHSDQGSQYTSEHFQQLLKEQCNTCGMKSAAPSRRANGTIWLMQRRELLTTYRLQLLEYFLN